MRVRATGPPDADRDFALLQRARSGDEGAFHQIVRKYENRVYGLGLRICGSREDAEDVVQETFLQVFRRMASFRGASQFSTWLYRVATNAALMHLRRGRRRRTESLTAYLPDFSDEGRHRRIDVDYSAAARIESVIERRELSNLVLAALTRVPQRYRVAIVLRDLQELSSAEAAAILRVDERTLRQRLHRARLMLRGYLGALAGKEDRCGP
jgi:RNA polymerase sigma-70 factor, ECF subfamily